MTEQWGVSGKAGRDRGCVGRSRTSDGKAFDESAIYANVELLRRAEAADVVGVSALESKLDRVLTVNREPMPNGDAPTGPER